MLKNKDNLNNVKKTIKNTINKTIKNTINKTIKNTKKVI